MSKVCETLLERIGRTPLVRIRKLTESLGAAIAVKMESFNPCGSVKDRIALSMIEAAERQGKLRPGGVVIEPSSGNTGVGLAFVGAVKGYHVILTMPDTMGIEQRNLLELLGAELVLTPGIEGMRGTISKAEELARSTPEAFIPQQFENPANPDVHRRTTAEEIWADTDGGVDLFVAGVGTGGTITGVGEALKTRKAGVKVVAVEPADSPVLSGGKPGPHKIQGIGAGFVPHVLNVGILDEIVTVTAENAAATAVELARREGITCGLSSGANVWAALKLARRPENKNKLIVTLICDTGKRYPTVPVLTSGRAASRIPRTTVLFKETDAWYRP